METIETRHKLIQTLHNLHYLLHDYVPAFYIWREFFFDRFELIIGACLTVI